MWTPLGSIQFFTDQTIADLESISDPGPYTLQAIQHYKIVINLLNLMSLLLTT